jgi:hypothetical protein
MRIEARASSTPYAHLVCSSTLSHPRGHGYPHSTPTHRIEPLIYETVILGRSRLGEVHQFLRTLRSRPASFFATHVKTLVLTSIVTPEQATCIASVCTGVVNLSCSVPSPALLPAMDDLRHLRRLSIIARGRPVREPDFAHALYANVTHLEIITDGDGWTTWSPSCFAHLPRLTHLALTFEGDATLENLDALDAIPPSLRVLAILAHNDFVSCVTLDLVRENFEDERVAFMREGDHVQDWLGGLRGRENMWTRAESIVRAQSKR